MRWIAPSLLVLALLAGCGTQPVYLPAAPIEQAAGLDAEDISTLDQLERANKRKGSKQAIGADIGTENYKQVNANLYRGGVPNDDQLAALKKLGIKTDITLMSMSSPKEREVIAHEKEAGAALGLKVINISLPFNAVPPKAMLEQFLSTTQEKLAQPVYVHCIHGRDRTGTMVACYRMTFDHLSNQQALDEMETFGFNPKKYATWANFVLGFKPAS
ncbi:MAG: protein tyrosine/serine phosphatase [Cyanobacteria bacterium RYN_339]|nr:protein tyrosine/serine phosphatase [Cyanobacteria bacterium RYN_339]